MGKHLKARSGELGKGLKLGITAQRKRIAGISMTELR